MTEWYRTCQECGNEQKAKKPNDYLAPLTNSYLNSKCRKCKSPALDYGKYRLNQDEDWTN